MQLREERQQAVEKHVQHVHALLAEAKRAGQDDDVLSDADSQAEGWEGIKDEKPIEPIDITQEYIDEDRYTSVAIEAVNIDREGVHKAANDSDQEQETDEPESGESRKSNADEANKSAKKRPMKKRKKKFRYETKYERLGGKRKSKSGLRQSR
jgi:ribosomal RNA-processing protein 17